MAINRHAEELARANLFAKRRGKTIKEQLGAGQDGIVLSTGVDSIDVCENIQTAIKSFKYQNLFQRERDVYLRLSENDVGKLAGFAVPKLLSYDNELWIVEMEVVRPPFVVDFAGAYVDEPPNYPPESMKIWEEEKREQFEDRWDTVRELMSEFRRFGIFLGDVKPGNIMFDENI